MNVVLGTGNKQIDNYIKNMREVNVLTSITKREQIIDTVIDRNPHTIVLSSDLTGKLEYREIIKQIKTLKPTMKIVFLYGEKDNEYKSFINFLIEQGVYDFIIGCIGETNLTNTILTDATLEEVRPYLLDKQELKKLEEKEKKIKEKEKEQSVEESKIEQPQKRLEVLIVERIEERKIIHTQFLGNIKIAVGSLFERSGCTHLSLEIALYLKRQGYDCCLAVSDEIITNSIKDYYMLDKAEINGLPIYSDAVLGLNKHKIVVFDFGKIDDSNINLYYEQSYKILLTPSSAWEIDTVTEFIKDNPYSQSINFLYYPISDDYFKEIKENMAKGKCIAYKGAYNPDFTKQNADNDKIFSSIFKTIANSMSNEKKAENKQQKLRLFNRNKA